LNDANTLECIPDSSAPERATVLEVLDGDTIVVDVAGKRDEVRYIGMDAPERGDDASTSATLANAELVYGQEITMFQDVSDKDRFGRLLRYVVVDGAFVNLRLVETGLALARQYPPDVACAGAFAEAEYSSRTRGVGIWAVPLPEVAPSPAGPLPSSPVVTASDCDPSYPAVCIPSPPPDLDCANITFRRFAVKPPDPHRFDRDGDGIGCES
jgi:micrococcal nuclease